MNFCCIHKKSMNATLGKISPHCEGAWSTYHRCFFNQTIEFSKHPVATARAWHSLSSGGGEKRECYPVPIHPVFTFLVHFFVGFVFRVLIWVSVWADLRQSESSQLPFGSWKTVFRQLVDSWSASILLAGSQGAVQLHCNFLDTRGFPKKK